MFLVLCLPVHVLPHPSSGSTNKHQSQRTVLPFIVRTKFKRFFDQILSGGQGRCVRVTQLARYLTVASYGADPFISGIEVYSA